jgi:hypothetical protein
MTGLTRRLTQDAETRGAVRTNRHDDVSSKATQLESVAIS